MLDDISKDAWSLIVTTFEIGGKSQSESGVTLKVTDVTFSEGLLRPIINLADCQQLELVRGHWLHLFLINNHIYFQLHDL